MPALEEDVGVDVAVATFGFGSFACEVSISTCTLPKDSDT